MSKSVEVNGQVWVRTLTNDGERYQRLVRAPARGESAAKNMVTPEKLALTGEILVLDIVSDLN